MNSKTIFMPALFAITMASVASSQEPMHMPQNVEVSPYKKLVDWSVKGMVKRARPGSRRFPIFNVKKYPDAIESYEDGLQRYRAVARDAISVAFDPDEAPLFGGRYGRHRTLSLLLSIASWESGYKKHVDYDISPQARGDSGRSWCLMQVNLGKPICVDETHKRLPPPVDGKCEIGRPSTPSVLSFHDGKVDILRNDANAPSDAVSGQDLIANRKLCFRAGLRIIKKSFAACKGNPLEDRLAAYASGSCDAGKVESKRRIGGMRSWMTMRPIPMMDPEKI